MKEKMNYPHKNRMKFFKNFLLIICFAITCLTIKAQDTTSNPHDTTMYCHAYFSITQDSTNLNSISVNNQSAGNGLVYSWYFGDGATSSLKNPSHTYTINGNYTVCLKIKSTVDTCNVSYCENVSIGTCNAYFSSYDSLNDIYFSNHSTGNISDYLWDFGDGTVSTLKNPGIHTYPKGGSYNVCLTVSNPRTSCSASYCNIVKASSCYANISYTADSVGNGVSFKAIINGNVSNYLWDFGDGTTSTESNPYHDYNDNNGSVVRLSIGSNIDHLCSDTITKFVSYNNLLAITYKQDPISYGLTFTPTVKGDAYKYSWTFGDGVNSTETIPYHQYNKAGLSKVCLVVTSKTNPLSQSQKCIQIYTSKDSCSAYFTTKVEDAGGVMVQNLSGGNGTDYLWDFGDGITSTDKNPVPHIYKKVGEYKISLTVFNPLTSCSSFYYQMVNNRTCYGTFNATIGANGSDVAFKSNVSASVDQYSWDFGDGTVSFEANPHHVYLTLGKFSVSLKISSSLDSTCSYSCYKVVNIGTMCSAKFSIVKDSVNTNNVFIYYPSTANSTTLYSWNFGDGGVSNLQYPSHTFNNKGFYQVCLTVTNDTICSDTYCDTIRLGRASEFTLTVVNPLALGIKDIQPSSIGLENYPNPFTFSTTINYSIPVNGAVDLYVMDLLGNKIKTIEQENRVGGKYSAEWKPENVANGIYLLQLKVNSHVITKKIIVNK
ncbi:MAG: PKD domain-containing protein [Bacteroidia bacterium]